jgi:hypothetical protein
MKPMRNALFAAVAAASVPVAGLAQSAPAAKPSAQACPCADPRFAPITEKAKAVQEYWNARQGYKAASAVGSTVALFALLAHDGNTVAAAQRTYEEAFEKMMTTRSHAESLGGLVVKRGPDVESDVVSFALVSGVDYELKAP